MALLLLSSSAPPVTVAEARNHLRIDGTDDDVTLSAMHGLVAATVVTSVQRRGVVGVAAE